MILSLSNALFALLDLVILLHLIQISLLVLTSVLLPYAHVARLAGRLVGRMVGMLSRWLVATAQYSTHSMAHSASITTRQEHCRRLLQSRFRNGAGKTSSWSLVPIVVL